MGKISNFEILMTNQFPNERMKKVRLASACSFVFRHSLGIRTSTFVTFPCLISALFTGKLMYDFGVRTEVMQCV